MKVVFRSLMLNTTRQYELSTFRNKKSFPQGSAIIFGDFWKFNFFFFEKLDAVLQTIGNKVIWPYSSIEWEIKPYGDTNRDVLNRLLLSSDIFISCNTQNSRRNRKAFSTDLVSGSACYQTQIFKRCHSNTDDVNLDVQTAHIKGIALIPFSPQWQLVQ